MNNTNSLKLCSILCPRLCSSACVLLVTSSDGALQHFSPPVEQEVPPLNPAPLYTERLQMQPQNSHSSESSKAESLFGRSNKSCQSINPPTSCLLATSDSSAISFILITLTIKGSGACIIHDTAALMSEIKCNKLEITSLRHCDSIKILGNIGPCIIEGPARQDSCQACQACCNYWILPVTHTQINPVKITGYIDFFFFFFYCFCLRVLVSVYGCVGAGGRVHAGVCIFCIRGVCLHGCVCVMHVAGLTSGHKWGVGDHPAVGVEATSGVCKSGFFSE